MPVQYRRMRKQETEQLASLFVRVFGRSLASSSTDRTVLSFPTTVLDILNDSEKYIVAVAEVGERLLGGIAVSPNLHVCLFFVDEVHQRAGIGRGLLAFVIEEATRQRSQYSSLRVNAPPLAGDAFSALGFRMIAPPQGQGGNEFIPMELPLRSRTLP